MTNKDDTRTSSPPTPAVVPEEALEKGSSLWKDAWRRLLKNKAAMAGGIIVFFMMVACMSASLLAAVFTHFEFDEQHRETGARPPGARSVPAEFITFFDADEQSFSDADRNGDGRVTPQELSNLIAKLEFERFDEDDDGVLDAGEVEDAPVRHITDPSGDYLVLKTMQNAYTDFFYEAYDRYDTADDEVFTFSQADYDAAMAAVESGEEGELVKAFLKKVKRRLPLSRSRVRQLSRSLTKDLCKDLDTCTIAPENSRRFTDIFPVSQAERFLESYDEDGDGALAEAEFPGVPEPHTHFFGTDDSGRDLLTRILYGGRISFAVGLLATLVSFLIGVSYGAIAGYAGGWLDNVMMRFVDVLYGLPFMFVVILLMVIVGQEIYLLFIALGAVQWLTMSRIVRGQVITLKGQEFVEAARSIGVSPVKIVFRHLVPNALGPIIVYVTLTVPAVMLEEAFLSFLGLGVKAPDASWGTLANDGAAAMQVYPWLIIYPGMALAVTLLSLNFLGDGLRDALDPRMKKD